MVQKFAAAALSLLERAFGVVVKALTVFITGRKTPAYHPSRYYMRGPGPKWIAKHGVTSAPHPKFVRHRSSL
ncbi:hypothetical protein [Bradyrhizobium prioriisuperbiae]|uniref:hypothetical protein n=1 Tax=Bradyrhizobium prioriisuperbiae TaxID=2854389 RepID=UPI0028E4E97A|nr:hypothetical protein [Bradyrhizobium prioritasuperba]